MESAIAMKEQVIPSWEKWKELVYVMAYWTHTTQVPSQTEFGARNTHNLEQG